MLVKKVIEFLRSSGTDYEISEAPPAFTAQQTAEEAHIPGGELAKTVIVKADGIFTMTVLPAPARIDFSLLKGVTGAAKVELATEGDFAELFPDCEIGAMPPFGNLYGMKVFVEEELTKDEKISFYGCSHTKLIRIAYADYQKLVEPEVGRFSRAYAADATAG